jgi:hypothetical protein
MRYEIAFGIGFDRFNQRIDPVHREEAIKLILVEAAGIFGGCNLTRGQGAWTDRTGTLVVEESCTLTVDISGRGTEFGEADSAKVSALADFIRRMLYQDSVHVTQLVATEKNVEILD